MSWKKVLLIMLFSILFLLGISYYMWWYWLLMFIFIASIFLLFLLGKWRKKFKIISYIFGLFIVLFDIFLLIFMIIPVKSYEINTDKFYENKENYLKIYVRDTSNEVKQKRAKLYIIDKDGSRRENINFLDYVENTKVSLQKWDVIEYQASNKDLDTFVVLYLWDGSVIRMLPQTTIILNEVAKDINNLSNSKTNISVDEWSIRFRFIRFIEDGNSINIETKNWVMAIRGTAWVVSYSKPKNETVVLDYNHHIEVNNKKGESYILSEWEWVTIVDDKIEKNNIEEIMNKVSDDIKEKMDQFNILDQEEIKQYKQELEKYIEEEVGSLLKSWDFLKKIERSKIELLALRDYKYKAWLEDIAFYDYIKGDKEFNFKNISKKLSWNDVFIWSYFDQWEMKLHYLVDKFKTDFDISDISLSDFKNSELYDRYKTVVVNMKIQWKIDSITDSLAELGILDDIEAAKKDVDKLKNNFNNFINNIDF